MELSIYSHLSPWKHSGIQAAPYGAAWIFYVNCSLQRTVHVKLQAVLTSLFAFHYPIKQQMVTYIGLLSSSQHKDRLCSNCCNNYNTNWPGPNSWSLTAGCWTLDHPAVTGWCAAAPRAGQHVRNWLPCCIAAAVTGPAHWPASKMEWLEEEFSEMLEIRTKLALFLL